MGSASLPRGSSSVVVSGYEEGGLSGADIDARMMHLALEEARACLECGDVPVGAVVARAGEVLGRAGNERERRGDPTAHAEILSMRQAAQRLGTWRLEGCTAYVT